MQDSSFLVSFPGRGWRRIPGRAVVDVLGLASVVVTAIERRVHPNYENVALCMEEYLPRRLLEGAQGPRLCSGSTAVNGHTLFTIGWVPRLYVVSWRAKEKKKFRPPRHSFSLPFSLLLGRGAVPKNSSRSTSAEPAAEVATEYRHIWSFLVRTASSSTSSPWLNPLP